MKTLTLAAVLALTLAACGGREAENATGNAASAAGNLTSGPDGTEAASDTNVMMNGAVTVTPTNAAEFANMAAASDQFEIQSSQLAATKAASAGVKDFASMLVTEHTKSTAELKAAAAKLSPAVTPTPTLTAEQQANLDALRAAPSGAAFDQLYAQVQVPSHENALALMQGYAERGDQQALKDFAAKTAPVVEKHLETARGLAK